MEEKALRLSAVFERVNITIWKGITIEKMQK